MATPEATNTNRMPMASPTFVRGGWSSSVCDAFSGSHASRRDCCSLTCFGILQHDFNRHLLNEQVGSWWTRLVIWVLMPLTLVTGLILFLDKYAAFLAQDAVVTHHQHSDQERQDGSSSTSPNDDGSSASGLGMAIFLIALPSYMLVLSLYSSFHRRKARRILLRKLYDAKSAHANNIGEQQMLGGRVTADTFVQLQEADTQAAHCCLSFWGCYGRDTYTTGKQQDSQYRPDLCTCLWKTLASMCCGCCGSWWQCCGMCALSQETRELQRILPTSSSSNAAMWQRDYITFQPWTEYIFNLQDLRTNKVRNFFVHLANISKLSQRMLLVLAAAFVWLALVAVLDLDPNFTARNLLVVLATFLQAFGIMFFVHWQWNRFDISLDAIIKYFTCGFCLCTSLSLVYEMILGTILSATQYVVIFFGILGEIDEGEKKLSRKEVEEIINAYQKNHIGIFAIFVAVNAFIIAAGVEEIAKYFSFWMLEHPDLTDPKDIAIGGERHNQQQQHQQCQTTYQSVEPLATTTNNKPDEAVSEPADKLTQPSTTCSNSLPSRTHVSQGAAITIAMVAVSAGFACSENLLYVFIYTPPNIANEVATLVARSMFPVHELCAAMQSIGVVRRDVEGDKTSQLGRIILAAWLLHGSFDFVLMLLRLLQQSSSSSDNDQASVYATDDGAVNREAAENEIIPLIISLAIVAMGLMYYCCLSRRQRKRLSELDQAATDGGASAESRVDV